MSLRKKPTITQQRVAASQANGRRSHGPATPPGRERIRDANTRHGFYSKAEGVVLRALGENPDEFDAMVKALIEKWRPANGFEELLVMRLARALWGTERSHRMQEGYALRQAKEVDQSRESRLHAEMMRLKMREDSLQFLAQAVKREHYVTHPGELGLMKSLREEGALEEIGEIAFALFCELQEPGAPGRGETQEGEEPRVDVRQVATKIRAIFGLGPRDPEPEPSASPRPFPEQGAGAGSPSPAGQQVVQATEADGAPGSSRPQGIPEPAGGNEAEEEGPNLAAAEWEAREPVRQLLENILTRQVE